MDRRSFLLGTGALTLSQLVAACGRPNQATLQVQVLKSSIPAQLVNKFRHSLEQDAELKDAELKFTPVEQLDDLFTQLQAWKKQQNVKSNPRSTTIVTLGDYWLASAIKQKFIQPLDPAHLGHWSHLPEQWQQLVRRNSLGDLDAQAKEVWAAPYSWGTTVIAYNRDKFKSLGWTPRDWSDLWRKEVRGRISLLDQPREVIGLTLKQLSQSYNSENFENSVLETELGALHRQVKFYSSETYLQPLILGDTWLAVGWSTDVLPVIQRYQQISAVIPQSGTALWANLWVLPTGANHVSLGNKWIDFCWDKQTAQQISLLSQATSPIPVTLNPDNIQEELRSLLLPDPEIIQRSDFLLPLPVATLKQYESLWKAMRQGRY